MACDTSVIERSWGLHYYTECKTIYFIEAFFGGSLDFTLALNQSHLMGGGCSKRGKHASDFKKTELMLNGRGVLVKTVFIFTAHSSPKVHLHYINQLEAYFLIFFIMLLLHFLDSLNSLNIYTLYTN